MNGLLFLVVEDEYVTGNTVVLDPCIKLFFGYLFFFSFPGLFYQLLELCFGNRTADNDPSGSVLVCKGAGQQ